MDVVEVVVSDVIDIVVGIAGNVVAVKIGGPSVVVVVLFGVYNTYKLW